MVASALVLVRRRSLHPVDVAEADRCVECAGPVSDGAPALRSVRKVHGWCVFVDPPGEMWPRPVNASTSPIWSPMAQGSQGLVAKATGVVVAAAAAQVAAHDDGELPDARSGRRDRRRTTWRRTVPLWLPVLVGVLIQGKAGGQVTSVAQTVGGAGAKFASPQEVIDSGYGTDWAKQVQVIPARAFDLLPSVPRKPHTHPRKSRRAGDTRRTNRRRRCIHFRKPQEVIDSGYAGNWAEQVLTIPTRAFNLLLHAPADGTIMISDSEVVYRADGGGLEIHTVDVPNGKVARRPPIPGCRRDP
jgi:hypothetical protein